MLTSLTTQNFFSNLTSLIFDYSFEKNFSNTASLEVQKIFPRKIFSNCPCSSFSIRDAYRDAISLLAKKKNKKFFSQINLFNEIFLKIFLSLRIKNFHKIFFLINFFFSKNFFSKNFFSKNFFSKNFFSKKIYGDIFSNNKHKIFFCNKKFFYVCCFDVYITISWFVRGLCPL